MTSFKKILFLILGWIFLSLGILGVFLPLLPTTPFILLAAYFFSRSHQPMHQWLLQQKRFGPVLREWEAHGVISLKTKRIATFAIVILFSYTLLKVSISWMIKIVLCCLAVLILGFIWTRPSRIKSQRPSR